MILGKLTEIGALAVYGERMKKAAEYIAAHDISQFELGKHQIDGDDIFVNVQMMGPRTREDAKIETHNKYIDIQIPFTGVDTMGYIHRSDLPENEYDESVDMTLYDGLCPNYIAVKPGMFTVFFPEDGHQPAITDVPLKRAIVKVRV